MRHARAAIVACIIAVTAVLTACSSASTVPAGETWSFTDDLGKTVNLPHRPVRVAGLTDLVGSLWNYGITPVAAFGFVGVEQDQRLAGKDLSQVVELGTSYGQINMEALAAARPDLIVTHAYPVDEAGTIDPAAPLYGFADIAQQEAAAKIAPIVAITMSGSAVTVIDHTEKLASALGADPAKVAAARAEYTAATDRLRGVAAASPVSVLVVAAYPAEGLYVAKAKDDPALRSFAELGVRFVDPGGDKYYWRTVSWEKVSTVPADVVLESQIDPMSKADLMAQPTFAVTPAAQADQVYPWIFATMDGHAQAAFVNQLADELAAARKVT